MDKYGRYETATKRRTPKGVSKPVKVYIATYDHYGLPVGRVLGGSFNTIDEALDFTNGEAIKPIMIGGRKSYPMTFIVADC